jgi:hypothetical protein
MFHYAQSNFDEYIPNDFIIVFTNNGQFEPVKELYDFLLTYSSNRYREKTLAMNCWQFVLLCLLDLPCASPANLGYRAWASILGASKAVGRTWTASFGLNLPIPGASFEIGVANVGARAELSAEINRLIISTNFAIGVCGRIGVGFFQENYEIHRLCGGCL